MITAKVNVVWCHVYLGWGEEMEYLLKRREGRKKERKRGDKERMKQARKGKTTALGGGLKEKEKRERGKR